MRTIASGGFARFAWAAVAYNLVVVLWGALVRATGSGAGCGGHWPLCNGEWTPHSPAIATLIEFTHRAMSGLALAIATGACIFYAASAAMKARREARNTALAVWLLVLAQIVVGALNIALLAPVWMQIVHLLVADLLWIALVLLALRTAAERTEGSSYVELV